MTPSLANVLAPGNYDFFVEAYAGHNLTGADQCATLHHRRMAEADHPRRPCAYRASYCTLHDTPTLGGEPMPNIGSSACTSPTAPNFTNILREWTTTFSLPTPAGKSLPDSQAGEAYYWYARPCYTPTCCAPFDRPRLR